MAFTTEDKRMCAAELRALSVLMLKHVNADGGRTLSADQLRLVTAMMERGSDIIVEELTRRVPPGGRRINYRGDEYRLVTPTKIMRACGRHLALIDGSAPIDPNKVDQEGRLLGPCPECKLEGTV